MPPARVYNMRVAEYHTCYVGHQLWGFSVWSHDIAQVRLAPRGTEGGGSGGEPAGPQEPVEPVGDPEPRASGVPVGGGVQPRKWTLGGNKSAQKWQRQMQRRGWTPEQIDDAIANGQTFPAPNNIDPGNGGTRYVNPQTGRSVVIDNKTGEVIHVGGDGFKY